MGSKAGVGGRLWWSAIASVTLAAVLVAVSAAVVNASRPPPTQSAAHPPAMPNTSSSGATSMPDMSGPPGMSSTAQNGGTGMAGMQGSSAANGGVCPDVQGATVMSNGMVMAPVPSGPPTPEQQAAADQLVSNVDQGVQQYSNLSAAESAGYRPASNASGPMTHYLDPKVLKSGDVLDPEHPSALMFANTVKGPILLGAMFLGPATCQPGPDVGGSLTQWHAHDNLCMSSGQLSGRTDSNGQCATGTHNTDTYFMLHVWTAPSIAAQFQFQADVPVSVFEHIDQTGRP